VESLQEDVAHYHGHDVKVREQLYRDESLYFDNLVIFSWLFKHKLRGSLTVQLARCT